MPLPHARVLARQGHEGEFVGLAAAEQRIVMGDWPAAIQFATTACDDARRGGWRARYVDTSEVLLDALLLSGQQATPTAARTVEALRTITSLRSQTFADLYQRHGEPSVLQRCANTGIASATRRARVLLGGSAPLDRVDAAVIHFLRTSSRLQIQILQGAPDAWDAAWGLDLDHHEVWLTSGAVVELQRKPLLWRLLRVLAEHGTATKEDLILKVWDERAYHPGRHDPRVHMTIRKIRELVEDDPSHPKRIRTVESGYAVGATVRCATRC